MVEFKKELQKHYIEQLKEAIRQDTTALYERMEREAPKRYEIDLRQDLEQRVIDNQFIFWKITSKLKSFIELKYVHRLI